MRISDWSSDVCSSDLVGFLVGVYALASAICAIPLVSATLAVDRKTLLMALLIGFAVSNIVVAVSSSFEVIVASRILGGICAGVMWPMIAAYGTRLVPENMHGKARYEEPTSELQSLMRIS